MTDIATLPAPAPRPLSLVQRVAARYEVEPEKLLTTLKATCFKQASDKPAVSNEQMMSLLIVAEQYHLNPFTKELFAFADKGGIIPFVSVDGWSRIVNEHPQFDGMEFFWDDKQQSMTCTIHRKDRNHPTVVTEYMEECKRGTQPWQSHPRRMLRHKSLMQCARLAFGFAGIYDADEAAAIRDNDMRPAERPASTQRARLQQVLKGQPIEDATTVVSQSEADPEHTLADLLGELHQCIDADQAAEVLDRGRSSLTESEYAELAGIYANEWETKEAS